MLEIRAAQFDALAAASAREADRAIAADLRRRTPDRASSEAELVALVGRARVVASGLGLSEDRDVATIAGLMSEHGEDFHTQERFARFFRAKRVSPGGRLESLVRSLGDGRRAASRD